MKRFRTAGTCNPNMQYMVDISDKVEQVKKLVENNEYFIINRPRQYGKTTLLSILRNKLIDGYLVISISFERFGSLVFSDEKLFCETFLKNCSRAIRFIDKDNSAKLLKYSKGVTNLDNLSDYISEFIEECDKETILIIDEVDKSSNNQLFIDFLSILRDMYLSRISGYDVAFKSVILAGVYDIKNLKLKLRPNEERRYNSPWNIIVPFNVDMSLSKAGIKGMLEDYKKDRDIELDTEEVSKFIYFYTNGYPFLVSRMCQIVDEELGASWTKEDMLKSVKHLLNEKNTLFDDVIKNVSNNKDLYDYIFDIVFNGEEKDFNIDNNLVDLGVTFGYFKGKDGRVEISNRLLEQRLYNYFVTNLKLKNVAGYNIKANFIEGTGLNIKKIIIKFQEFMKEQYSNIDKEFLEREGRLLFLAFIKPIINGTGFAFKEVQISEEKRLDVVITYNNNKYIIELKIWRGEEYHERGLKQLADYLDINNQKKGIFTSI